MKTLGRVVALSLLAVLIVLSTMSFVNYNASKLAIADGKPLLWPMPPKVSNNAVLTAEGNPLPYPKPPKVSNNAVLTAEGNPLPYPKPPIVSLVA